MADGVGKTAPPFPHSTDRSKPGPGRGHDLGEANVSSTPEAPGGKWFGADLPVEDDRFMGTTGGYRPSDRNSDVGNRGLDLGTADED